MSFDNRAHKANYQIGVQRRLDDKSLTSLEQTLAKATPELRRYLKPLLPSVEITLRPEPHLTVVRTTDLRPYLEVNGCHLVESTLRKVIEARKHQQQQSISVKLDNHESARVKPDSLVFDSSGSNPFIFIGKHLDLALHITEDSADHERNEQDRLDLLESIANQMSKRVRPTQAQEPKRVIYHSALLRIKHLERLDEAQLRDVGSIVYYHSDSSLEYGSLDSTTLRAA